MLRVAFVLAGTAAGAVARRLNGRGGSQIDALQAAVANLEAQLRESTARLERRMTVLESRIDDHEKRLQEVPSMAEITAAVEGLLARGLTRLERRFAVQTDSIDLLKTTVSETDTLLERVLESLDSIRQQ